MNKLMLIRPYNRESIQGYLKTIIDKEKQSKWFDSTRINSFWNKLDCYVYEPLFDNIMSFEYKYNLDDAIGFIVYNEQESEMLFKFLKFFDSIVDIMPDTYYVNHPMWPELIERAEKLINLMNKNNDKYNLERNIEIYDQVQENSPNETFQEDLQRLIKEELELVSLTNQKKQVSKFFKILK